MAQPKAKTRRANPYYVLDRRQLSAMASPIRQDIVDHLAAHDEMSIKELGASIGRNPSSIYHHLNMLLEVGLVEESGARIVNRKTEKLYTTPSRRMRLKKALEDPANNDIMQEIVAALCRQTERDFSHGLNSDDARRTGSAPNLRFFRLVNRPSPSALADINAKLDEIGEILWREPDPKSPMVALTWILSPMRSTEGE